MNDTLYYTIALSMIKNIGPITAKNLISYCGSAQAVFESPKNALLKVPSINKKKVELITHHNVFKRTDEQIAYISKNDISAYTYLDKAYPQRLRNFDNSPIVLYSKGSVHLNHPRTVAIVGTRKITERGRIICEELVENLKEYDVQIISGLAYGVDACAHKTSVKCEISTIGVMGHGHDTLYPAAHRELAASMLKKGGLLSEFPIKSRVDKEHFPLRNRIIAMMSDAVVVIESDKKGGSMITADFANEYYKDVFAVPGRISDKYSSGCNLLIKSNRAHLLESSKDIAYIMMWDQLNAKKVVQKSLFVELDDTEKKVVDMLKQSDSSTIDNIHSQLNISNSALASVLINLEFKGVIRSLPGKKYMLT